MLYSLIDLDLPFQSQQFSFSCYAFSIKIFLGSGCLWQICLDSHGPRRGVLLFTYIYIYIYLFIYLFIYSSLLDMETLIFEARMHMADDYQLGCLFDIDLNFQREKFYNSLRFLQNRWTWKAMHGNKKTRLHNFS